MTLGLGMAGRVVMGFRRQVLLAAVLGLGSAACSSTTTLRGPITPTMAEQVSREASGKRVELTLSPEPDAPDPGPRQGTQLVASAGAFAFRESSKQPSPLLTTVPLDRVRAIKIKKGNLGALEGAIIGALPGLLAGYWFGSAIENIQCSSDASQRGECRSYAPKMALGFSLGTAAIGALIGAAIGHRTTYVFAD